MQSIDRMVYAAMINDISAHMHFVNVRAGWWTDRELGEVKDSPALLKYFIGAKMALVQSEVSEALEGYRKDAMDDHLPTRKAVEVEFADALIRIFDLAGALNLDLGGAIIDKLAYNEKRVDHTKAHREAEGGKKF